MHLLFYHMWDLLPRFVYSLVNIVMLYDGLTMTGMVGANHMNTIHFLQVSICMKRFVPKLVDLL